MNRSAIMRAAEMILADRRSPFRARAAIVRRLYILAQEPTVTLVKTIAALRDCEAEARHHLAPRLAAALTEARRSAAARLYETTGIAA